MSFVVAVSSGLGVFAVLGILGALGVFTITATTISNGLGWVLRDFRGRVVIQHGGAIDGMRSVVALVPQEKLGFVILTNRGQQLLPEALVCWICDRYLHGPDRDWAGEFLKLQKGLDRQRTDLEKKQERERVLGTNPSLPLEKYAGVFENELYGEIRVNRRRDGGTVT